MMILHLQGRAHLTLEYARNKPSGIDREGNLYGLPLDLLKAGPQLVDPFIKEAVGRIVDEAKLRYPMIEKSKAPAIIRQGAEIPMQEIPSLVYEPPQKRGARTKKMGRLTPIAQYLSQTPEPPKIHEHQRRQFIVIHSRAKVKEFLGGNIPEKVVDRVMEEIRDFEFGRSEVNKKLEAEGLWELRTGNHRIILEHGRGRFYALVNVDDRKDIFKKK